MILAILWFELVNTSYGDEMGNSSAAKLFATVFDEKWTP